jgi:GcrA cell cycle regulator
MKEEPGGMWTTERVEMLTRLWAEGYSARQIAEKLGSVTRNAVIGKAHRLNLQRGAVKAPAQLPPEPKIIQVIEVPIMPRINDGDVSPWMCCWPTSEPGRHGLHICGKTVQPGRQFCAEHLTARYVLRKRSAA